MTNLVDIPEDEILEKYPEALEKLLLDHTTRQNIFWATDSYDHLGEGYGFKDSITIDKITKEHGSIIQPRVRKNRELQEKRTGDKAEVFTPCWICNAQNNLIDEAWFGRKNVFNTEYTTEDGHHLWTPTEGDIEFDETSKDKTWRSYVRDVRLEITCGEAPYLVSRYDTTTGNEYKDLKMRVGLLDRKLRVVSEHCHDVDSWLRWAKYALKATYGFEWQGDNLLLAREAILYTVRDYYVDKFQKEPKRNAMKSLAFIISWNIWQMDGIKLVVPETCHEEIIQPSATPSMFDHSYGEEFVEKPKAVMCPACKSGARTGHNGVRCRIRNWSLEKAPKDWDPECEQAKWSDFRPWQLCYFEDLINQ